MDFWIASMSTVNEAVTNMGVDTSPISCFCFLWVHSQKWDCWLHGSYILIFWGTSILFSMVTKPVSFFCIQFSQHQDTIFSHWTLLAPLSNISWLYMHSTIISGFLILIHWSMCLFLCQYHTVFTTRALYMFWNQEVWCLQLCSVSRYLRYFCGSIKILGFFYIGILNFDKDYIESINSFGHYGHFININSSDPWTQYTIPFICVFFNIFN